MYILRNTFFRIPDYIGKGNFLHLAFHCFLHLLQFIVEDTVNIPAYETFRIGIFMEVKKLSVVDTLNCVIDVEKSDLLQRLSNGCTAAASLYIDKSCSF